MRSVSCMLPLLVVAGSLGAAPVVVEQTEGRITLTSGKLVAAFDTAKTGGLVRLETPGGRNLLVAPGNWFGVGLWAAEKGEIRLYSHDATGFACTVKQEGEEAVVEAEGSGFPERNGLDLAALKVRVSVRLGPDDEALRWRCSADVPPGVTMQRFEAPRVELGVPFGESGADDAVVVGHPKGGVGSQPDQWKKGASMGGVLSAQFGCAYDQAGGVMTMACDGEGYEKWLYGQRNDQGLLLYWRHAVTGVGSVTMPYDTLVRPFVGTPTDWRDAADIYRAWALEQSWCAHRFADRPDVAAWMKTGPTHVRFGRNWLADPEMIDLWFERYWDPYFAGMPLIVTFWGWEKHGSWVAPDYFPPFPSAEVFAKLVETVRKRNGHVFLWPSGYHWTVSYQKGEGDTFAWDDREHFAEAGGMDHVSIDANGKPRISGRSWLQGGSNASMCPGDPWTRQWFDDIAKGCLGIGADMVQVDQVVRGAFPDCFSEKHGHMPGNGLWKTQVVDQQLQSLLALGKAGTPDFVLGVEEPQEWFNHRVGIQDYRDFEVVGRRAQTPGEVPTSVYGYVYHDFLPVFQSNPRGNDPVCQAYCLASGQIPHLVPSMRILHNSLLLNGSFEEWTDSVPRYWDKVGGWKGEVWKGSCRRDTEMVAEGNASLLLENGDGEVVQVAQNIPIGRSGLVPGHSYRITIKLRTEGVQEGNQIGFGALAPGLKGLGGGSIPLPATTNGAWQDGAVDLAIPAGANVLRIMLNVRGKGKVWLDDMQLTPLEPVAGTGKPLPSDHELMVQWSQLFHGEGRPWLLLGQMIHPPRLETATFEYDKITLPAVFHNAFRAQDGQEAVILVNATDAEQTVTLHGKQVEKLTLQPYEVRLVRQ